LGFSSSVESVFLSGCLVSTVIEFRKSINEFKLNVFQMNSACLSHH